MADIGTLTRYACDGIDGRNWYRHATAQIDFVAHAEGWDSDEFAGVLATTSPRCSVLRNIRMSLHFMKHRDLRVVPMRGIRRSVQNFLDGKGIKGQKTYAFYRNLSGHYENVTLDVWMAYALGIDQTDFNRVASRAEATRRVVRVARRLRIEPAEAQAAIWTGYRRGRGYSDSPFSVVSEYLTARDNEWEIEGCSIHAN
jgi:hypothetical protein